MKTLEESIAAAMDAQQDVAIIPFLPYILQDFWGLGTPAEIVINLMQKHCFAEVRCAPSLHVLDLGCGKGAVSVKLAAALKCNCYGIDAIPEFIETAKEKAHEYGVDTLCRFEVGDVRKKIEELDRFDVIILGATGPIFDDYYTALTALSKHLTDKGIVIIEEAYMDDTNTFQHPLILPRRELLSQFQQAGMKLIEETVGNYNEFADIAKEVENIAIRCNELKTKYPEKSSLFENYAQNQVSEYDALENEMIGAVMVLRKNQMDNNSTFRCFGDTPLYADYHDNEWGRPVHDDRKLFEMLILEGAQAGLSWITVLKKRESYRKAFDNFDAQKIALYDDAKVEELMANEGIIRNRLKIQATIINAKAFLEVVKTHGSFDRFLWAYVDNKPIVSHIKKFEDYQASTPLSDKISKDLKKLGFKFVGSTIIYAFMQAVGMVNDHLVDCFVYKELTK